MRRYLRQHVGNTLGNVGFCLRHFYTLLLLLFKKTVTIKHDHRCVFIDSEHSSRQVVIENHKIKKYETLSNQTLKI